MCTTNKRRSRRVSTGGYSWHKMVTNFKDASSTLCNSVAALARRLSTEYVDPAWRLFLPIEGSQSTYVLVSVLWEWEKS